MREETQYVNGWMLISTLQASSLCLYGCTLYLYIAPATAFIKQNVLHSIHFFPFRFLVVAPFGVAVDPRTAGPPPSTSTVSSSLPPLSPPRALDLGVGVVLAESPAAGPLAMLAPAPTRALELSSSSAIKFDWMLALSLSHHSRSALPSACLLATFWRVISLLTISCAL